MKTKVIKIYFNSPISCKWGIKKSLFMNYNAQLLRCYFDKWLDNNNYDINVYRFSDFFPFVNDILLVSKPCINFLNIENSDVSFRKKMKILEYIPLDALSDYYFGKLEGNLMKELEESIGSFSVLDCGELKFNDGSGLYLILRTESEILLTNFMSFLQEYFTELISTLTVSDLSFFDNPNGKKYYLLESLSCDTKFEKNIFQNSLYKLEKNEQLDGKILVKSGSVFSESIREINGYQALTWRF